MTLSRPRLFLGQQRQAHRDRGAQALEFRDGDVYLYYKVPARVFEGLMLARSAGRFFALEIRDVYGFKKLNE